MAVFEWSPLQQQIAELLIRKTLRVGMFSFRARDANPSLPRSRVYFDIRPEHLSNNEKFILARFLAQLTGLAIFDAVVGVPDGATLFAQNFFSLYVHRTASLLTIDKETEEVQTKEGGEIQPGQRVLIIENALSSGGSIRRKAIAPLVRCGLETGGILTILDWELGGRELLENDGHAVRSAFGVSELVAHAMTMGLGFPGDLSEKVHVFQEEWRLASGLSPLA